MLDRQIIDDSENLSQSSSSIESARSSESEASIDQASSLTHSTSSTELTSSQSLEKPSGSTRLKNIRYGEAYLQQHNIDGKIDWENYTTPCIPELFTNQLDVHLPLLISPVMFNCNPNLVMEGETLQPDQYGLLTDIHRQQFVHLRYTDGEALKKSYIDCFTKLATSALQGELTPEMKQALMSESERLLESLDKLGAEKKFFTEINLACEWYIARYLEKDPRAAEKEKVLQAKLDKIWLELLNIIELEEAKTSIKESMPELGLLSFTELEETLPKEFLAKTSSIEMPSVKTIDPVVQIFLKYIHEAGLTYSINRFLQAQEKIYSLENDVKLAFLTPPLSETSASKLPKQYFSLSQSLVQRHLPFSMYRNFGMVLQKKAQDNLAKLREFTAELDVSIRLFKRAFNAEDVFNEDQTYWELQRQIELWQRCRLVLAREKIKPLQKELENLEKSEIQLDAVDGLTKEEVQKITLSEKQIKEQLAMRIFLEIKEEIDVSIDLLTHSQTLQEYFPNQLEDYKNLSEQYNQKLGALPETSLIEKIPHQISYILRRALSFAGFANKETKSDLRASIS